MIIAFTAASYVHPMIRGSYKGNEIVQSTFSIHSVMTPFRNIIRAFFISPLMAKSCQSRVVIVHCDKRATRSRESIRSTAEVLDHSFAFGISGRSDVECSSRSLFLAKESYLSERQDFSQLFHGRCCEKNLFFLLIPRYEFFTGRRDGWVELLNTSRETRSQPPEITQGSDLSCQPTSQQYR